MRNANNRSLYKMLKSKLAAAGFKGTISEGYVNSILATANGQSSYDFTLLEGANNPNVVENRLSYQDAIVVSHVGLRFRKITSVAGISTSETYNNATVFPDEAGGAGFLNAHLAVFHNGKLVVKIGDTTYKPAVPLRRSLFIPQTQQSSATTKSQVSDFDGLIALDSPLILKGSEDNGLSFVIPANSSQKVQYTDTATNGTVYVELYMVGYTITGGNKVDFKKALNNDADSASV